MDKEQNQNTSQPARTGCLTIIIRLTWMAFGNLLLVIIAFLIAQQRAGIVLDIAFWAVVAGLILTRYVDINLFHGNTADNEPATPQHWRRYSIQLIVISAVIWVVAHGAVRVLQTGEISSFAATGRLFKKRRESLPGVYMTHRIGA